MNLFSISLILGLLCSSAFGQTTPTSSPFFSNSEDGLIFAPKKDPNFESSYSKISTFDTCIILKPGAANGKDAYINSVIPGPVGAAPSMVAARWTYAGTSGVGRSLIEFDLSSIPSIAIITSARMGLFWDPTGSHVGHSSSGGSNAGFIRRVTSPWGEFSTTWLTQPSFTTTNQVVISQSPSANTDYPNLPVSNLVFDIWNNPATSHGFIIMLQSESQLYRSLRFASSDNANPTIWPELEVCYSIPILSNQKITLSSYYDKNDRVVLEWDVTENVIGGAFVLERQENDSWKNVPSNLLPTNADHTLVLPQFMSENQRLRIKWTSNEGQIIFSNNVEINKSKAPEMLIFPNPCHNILNVAHSQPRHSSCSGISIWDMNGRLLFGNECIGIASKIDVSGLPIGRYIVQANGLRRNFVKQ